MNKFGRDHIILPNQFNHGGYIYIDPLEPGENCYLFSSGSNSYLVNSDTDSIDAVMKLEKWFFDEHKHIPIITKPSIRIKPPKVNVTVWKNIQMDWDTKKAVVLNKEIYLKDLQSLHECCLQHVDFVYGQFQMFSAAHYEGNIPVWYRGLFCVNDDPIVDEYFYDWLSEIVY